MPSTVDSVEVQVHKLPQQHQQFVRTRFQTVKTLDLAAAQETMQAGLITTARRPVTSVEVPELVLESVAPAVDSVAPEHLPLALAAEAVKMYYQTVQNLLKPLVWIHI